MPEWSIPAVLDVLTDAVPDREMVVWCDVRRTFAEAQDRTRRLAERFVERGLGVQRERAELDPWECGQSRVAIVLSNGPEYLEAMIGAYRARAVPYNVNHHYQPGEVAALVASIGADAVVYHRRFGPKLAEIAGLADLDLLEVDDGSDAASLPGSTPYEEAIAATTGTADLPEPSPDDLYMVCTGGTTGVPKGVLWRQHDVYVAGMNGADANTPESIAEAARNGAGIYFAAPPMMHGAAQWTAFSGILNGGTAVLHDDARRFDARTILTIAAREKVNIMSIVGDAFARPIVEELRRNTYDLSSLFILGTGGAATNPAYKEAILDLVPHITIMDGYGASETGSAAFAPSSKDRRSSAYVPAAGSAIADAAMERFLGPDDTETGWAVRTGHIPLGYLDDPDKTARTFVTVDGVRASVPGDRARYDDKGNIVMFGRDSQVVNTGGEKVFAEEVEEVLRQHPSVADALVVGRPNDRLGSEVVAIVQAAEGAEPIDPTEVRTFVAERIARYKAPRAVLVCDEVARLPTGKADYRWATEAALDAVPATA